MRDFRIKAAMAAMIAGASLLAAACGSESDDAANDAGANVADSNAMLVEPANDASAMESAVNATEPAPPANDSGATNETGGVLGETSGGDTGGNTVDSNVTGM